MEDDSESPDDIALFRALLTFGGDRTMGRDFQAELLPAMPGGVTYNRHWQASGDSQDEPQNVTDAEEIKAQELRQNFLKRQLNHERIRNSR